MGLKEFRDNWETWSTAKKVISVIVGCCVLTFIFAMIGGALVPDYNTTYDDMSSSFVDEDEPFLIDVDKVPVEESSLSITSQDSQSSAYAYFYTDGSYAEPAYTTYTAEDFYIKLNMNKIKLSNDSKIDYSMPFDSGENVYNQSHLTKDITKLMKSDDVSVKLTCYDKHGSIVESYDDFKISMKNGILTLKYSYSDSSDYHTGKHADSSISDIDYAKIQITGTLSGKNATRDISFDLLSKAMDVSVNT